ncbi:3'-5' DNA helicase [Vermiconidia calcicola]|uniref:3'-5' DNA helicase n=1 Tax=Vermiconidia calcicola TaxID=1690605 RepID=A0ACC3NPS6_9PEZI|nr:3'-5' DNA helicase [Vermiconidia calcicola]
MPHSDDFGLEDDDTEFIAAATQVEASQHGGFEACPRPAKRRRIRKGPRQLDGASSQEVEWSETDDEGHSPPKKAAATQTQAPLQRTASDDEPEDDPEYYFPGEIEGADNQPAKNSKYKIHVPRNGGQFEAQIFTQTQVGLDSSPSHFRGAVWKRPKPPPPPPPVFGERSVNAIAPVQASGIHPKVTSVGKQTTLNGVIGFGVRAVAPTEQSDTELAARLQAEEDALGRQRPKTNKAISVLTNRPSLALAEELADLPSDAFSSSSPEKSPQKEVIELSSQVTASQAQVHGLRGPQQGLKQMTIFGQAATQDLSVSQAAKKKHAWPLKSREETPTHHKLDDKAMETWVYPTNLGTIRDYQYNIVSRSLFHNTLVALPTGLGKTFIAATIMLNYYRWTKDAQMIFMAPTKPLIAQQMEACYHIVGIPRRDTVLMTGETTPGLRAEEWLEKKAFFMTPQTVINDLKTGICDPKKIVLVVVDEAHKATGSYAYTEVIKFLHRFNNSFRVLALTATPGSSVETVQAVIDSLGIARVELRTEQSLDIRPYTHEKHTDTEIFEYSEEQAMIMDLFSNAVRPVMEKLCTQNAYWSRDPMQLSTYGMTLARQKYMLSDAAKKAAQPVKGMVNAIFTVMSSLAHSVGLLKNHGIGPFYSGVLEFQKSIESGETKGKYATQIAQSEDFTKMMRLIRGWTNNPDFIGHPKLEYLREVVLNHFLDTGEGRQGPDVPPSATRVMVFASYRDSTEEICRVLKGNEPMIRPHVFVGQAASKGNEGMDQKRQNAVIQDFKSGKYNTLVATSIGEEGLDIGDVDLIVCYDASASPIRMLQRIGRTGRKRVGKVVLLLMKGKEENDYAKAQDNYTFIQRSIADTSKYNYRDEQSPRILPKGVQPVVDKRIVDIPVENSQPIDLNEKGRRAKGKGKARTPPKKFHMPDGVRTGFVKASKMDSDDDSEEAAPKRKTPAKKKNIPTKAKKPPSEPEPEAVQLPFLEDVLLDHIQQKELERKYAHTADTEADLIVRAPDPGRFPATLRDMGSTKYVQHGRAARVVERAMQEISNVSNARVDRMKELGDQSSFLQASNEANKRPVSPLAEVEEADCELPSNERPTAGAKKTARGRPRKSQTVQRTASVRSAATVDSAGTNGDPSPAQRTKKPCGRPKKNKAIGRTESYGSAAGEGEESSPEPTPAHMRIGTQGIDLGSNDTSGEEEDEEPDSELEEFVVRSDQPVEMASSSQRLPDDTQPPRPAKPRGRGLTNAGARRKQILSDIESEESDPGLAEMADDVENESTGVKEIAAPVVSAAAAGAKKRRVVDDSDSDE